MSDSKPTRSGGVHERVTVNLTKAASVALDAAVLITDSNRTNVINKSLIMFALLQETQEQGGAVYIRERGGGELSRLYIL